jgi:hypothetical protein
MSAEARIGTGITIAMIGLLFVMLGWAQHMREVKEAALMLLSIGAVLLVIGGIVAASGGVTKLRAADLQRP